MKAVLDRIVDGKAVLLVGVQEKEYIVAASLLPPEAKEGDWLQVRLEKNDVINITIDKEETETAKKRIVDKMVKLKSKSRSKFSK